MRTDRVRADRLLTGNVQAAGVPSRSSANLSRSTALRQLSQITLSHTVEDVACVGSGWMALAAVTSGRAPGAPMGRGRRTGLRARMSHKIRSFLERSANG